MFTSVVVKLIYKLIMNFRSPLSHIFLDACKELGYETIDYNGRKQVGCSNVQARSEHGHRVSAESAYLRIAKDRENLHIWSECFVTKIFINEETGCATGVEFLYKNNKFIVRGNKEILIAAGSINTAKLLMLSGIGPQKHLESLNIKVFQDLPVGVTLKNHIMYLGK